MLRMLPLQMRLHVTLSVLVLLVVVATAGIALAFVVHESWQAARETAQQHFNQLSESMRDRVKAQFDAVGVQVTILAGQSQMAAPIGADGRDHPAYPLFAKTLAAVPGLYSVYVGHADGSFLQVIAPRGQAAVLAAHGAPAQTELIVRTISGDVAHGERQTWLFLDAAGMVLRQDSGGDIDYDPRQRPWFTAAHTSMATVLSPPYLFNSLKAPGVTASARVKGDGVVGADLTLRGVQDFVDRQRVSDHGGMVIFDRQSRLLAMTGIAGDPIAAMDALSGRSDYPFAQIFAAEDDGRLSVQSRADDGANIVVSRSGLSIVAEPTLQRNMAEPTLQVAVFAPESDFTGRIDRMRRDILIVSVLLSALGLVLAWWLARQIVWPVTQLAADAKRARRWDFSVTHPQRSFITEIGALTQGFSLMKRSLVETLEQNPVGTVIANAEGVVEYANRAYLANAGYASLADLLGRPLRLWPDMETATRADALALGQDYLQLWRGVAHGGACRGEFVNRRQDGSTFWESVVIAPVCDDNGSIAHFIGVHEDISEKKAHQDELRRLVAHLSDVNTELERFAYVASHDLREPLRTVSTFIQLLRKRFGGQMGAEADEYIDFAVQGAQRMDALVNDLLAYSRVSRPDVAFVMVDTVRSCESAVQNLRDSLTEAGADIHIGALPAVLGDPVQLMQLFQNLIGNAVKFRSADRRPRITVSYDGVEDGCHLFAVSDNGIGIETSEQDIFEVFRRLHGQSQYPGTGIGLAICKRVVQRHGGRIWYQPNPDGGTIFRFSIATEAANAVSDPRPVADRRRPD